MDAPVAPGCGAGLPAKACRCADKRSVWPPGSQQRQHGAHGWPRARCALLPAAVGRGMRHTCPLHTGSPCRLSGCTALPDAPVPPRPALVLPGVRAFELDVYWDPDGGLYGQAAGLRLAGLPGWLDDPRYKQPGFKVRCVRCACRPARCRPRAEPAIAPASCPVRRGGDSLGRLAARPAACVRLRVAPHSLVAQQPTPHARLPWPPTHTRLAASRCLAGAGRPSMAATGSMTRGLISALRGRPLSRGAQQSEHAVSLWAPARLSPPCPHSSPRPLPAAPFPRCCTSPTLTSAPPACCWLSASRS